MSSQWGSLVKEAIAQASNIARFLCLFHLSNTYLLSSTLAYGSSMLPTLNLSGDVLLVEHVSHRLGKLRAGDVVLVCSPNDPKKMLTKRILGMEGDKVTFLPNPSHSDRTHSIRVPKGHVWIQGDNMYVSIDSQHFGPVPYGLIQGKVFWRVWPPYSFGSLAQ